MNDEIIEEVHAVKDTLGAKFNYDLRLMFEDIKRGEAELRAAGFDLVLPLQIRPTCLTRHCSGLASLAVEFAR